MAEVVPDLILVVNLFVLGAIGYLGYLVIRALRKYLRGSDSPK